VTFFFRVDQKTEFINCMMRETLSAGLNLRGVYKVSCMSQTIFAQIQ